MQTTWWTTLTIILMQLQIKVSPLFDHMILPTHNIVSLVNFTLGEQNGAVWLYSGSFENYMAKLHSNTTITQNSTLPLNPALPSNSTILANSTSLNSTALALGIGKRNSEADAPDYWLAILSGLGQVSVCRIPKRNSCN
jgi:hypothetical protein